MFTSPLIPQYPNLTVSSVKSDFFSTSIYIQALYNLTDVFIRPIRTILPHYLMKKNNDYTPLISAIFILFIGFGLNSFMKIIMSGLLLF